MVPGGFRPPPRVGAGEVDDFDFLHDQHAVETVDAQDQGRKALSAV